MATIKSHAPEAKRTAGSLHRDCSTATPECALTVANVELRQNQAAVYATVTLKDQHGNEYDMSAASFYWDLKRKP
jgi:hypothetical protein